MKTEYVAGFLFAGLATAKRVALITKAKPEWQKGRLNAIGGKIEHGEHPQAAMHREFLEETGLPVGGWRKFATLEGKTWRVHWYRAYEPVARMLTALPAEPVNWYEIDAPLPDHVLPNVRWLMELAHQRQESQWPLTIVEG